MTSGSRGDIQPFIAIALELSKKFNVRVLTNKGHADFVENFGLVSVSVWPTSTDDEIRNNEEVKTAMVKGDFLTFTQAINKKNRVHAGSHVESTLKELAANPPDLFIAGTLSKYWFFYMRHVLKTPAIRVTLSTVGYNRNHAPLGLPKLPFGLHYYILIASFDRVYSGFSMFDNEMLLLGKPTLSSCFSRAESSKYTRRVIKGGSPHKQLICQTDLFRSALFPAANQMTNKFVGACVIDAEQQKKFNRHFGGDEGLQKIQDFINEEPYDRRPVYCGWGSMLSGSSEHMVKLAVTALMLSGERAIVLGGTAQLSMDVLLRATTDEAIISYAKKNILFVEIVSHENVFSLVKCTIHHGGSGTTQAAMRAGVPTIITPVFLDQFDHAKAINMLGIGIGFAIPLQKITAKSLGEVIGRVTTDDNMIQKSRDVAKHLRSEGGKVTAAMEIEQILKDISTGVSMDLSSSISYSKLILPEVFVRVSCLFLSMLIFMFMLKGTNMKEHEL